MKSVSASGAISVAAVVLATIAVVAAGATPLSAQEQREARTVRARVQAHPGGPIEDVEMRVRDVPVDPESVLAEEADLEDGELVLGLVIEGRPMAYPIRYLAMFEVVNDRVGDTPLAPTW
jgi:hypothetical protein